MDILNVVDQEGNIVGEDTRENIHRHGLLHKEIHVCFYTPNGEIIFQQRAKDKDTFPDLLDATVGGHVEIGDDFEDAALKEILEETGIRVNGADVKLIRKLRKKDQDTVTQMTNNVIRNIYAYRYTAGISSLRVEDGQGQGFEAWPINKLIKGMSGEEEKKFIPGILTGEYLAIYQDILKLI